MKRLAYVFITFMIVSCSTNKFTYWCGDHPCINKKEKEAYFKKAMIVEIKKIGKKGYKKNSDIERIILQAQVNEKKRIIDEKELAKQAKLEQKRRIKEDKELAKQVKIDEKKIIKKKKKQSKQSDSIITAVENNEIEPSSFDKLVEKIIKRNSLKSYPDINDVPN